MKIILCEAKWLENRAFESLQGFESDAGSLTDVAAPAGIVLHARVLTIVVDRTARLRAGTAGSAVGALSDHVRRAAAAKFGRLED
jgi:hypothetical protein